MSQGYGPAGAFRNLAFSGFLILGLAASQAAAEPVTLAALGDSLTQGYGLPPEDGFVSQLDRWLDARGAEVRIINAGVSGDTTAGGLSRIDWTLADEPDALIVALGGNDVLRGLDPAEARTNLGGILDRADAEGVPVLLVGIAVPSNYGPDYEAAFRSIYPDLAAEHGALLYPDFLGALTEGRDFSVARRTLFQSDGIHPNAEGVAMMVEDMGPKVLELIERTD